MVRCVPIRCEVETIRKQIYMCNVHFNVEICVLRVHFWTIYVYVDRIHIQNKIERERKTLLQMIVVLYINGGVRKSIAHFNYSTYENTLIWIQNTVINTWSYTFTLTYTYIYTNPSTYIEQHFKQSDEI